MNNLIFHLTDLIKVKRQNFNRFLQTYPFHRIGRLCPICGYKSHRFIKGGKPIPRIDSMCPDCGSLERHRFVWLYFNKYTNLFDGKSKTMLHVAPEKCFKRILKKQLGENYTTADLRSPHVKVKMDIMNIKYPDEYFDIIYCSHVLEHVQDDRKAMREFYRVLKRDGWAILLVPITMEKTYEDTSILDPNDRFKKFGHNDHVRSYGTDYFDRLREAGFKVRITGVSNIFTKKQAIYMGIYNSSGKIPFCTKE